ncbi:metallophosphoesterase [Candidatus Woesearchaeota archaeon]|nr:metallophosphoesterase [Candidatus Woesearchaeota archaeon]
MHIFKNIEIIDFCLFLTKSKTLVIPDVHIGYEEALNKQGILIPRTQFKEIMINIEKIMKEAISKFKSINKIIILGDLKHEFGSISETEWRQTLRFLDFLSKFCSNIILIKGNHDTILGPIARKRNLEIADNCLIDDIFLVHGDKIPSDIPKQAEIIIIGHEHPAISLKHGPRVEKYKCFLEGNWIMENGIIGKLKKYAFIGTDINFRMSNSVPICRKHTNISDKVSCVCDIERTKQFKYVNLVRSPYVDFNKKDTNIKVHHYKKQRTYNLIVMPSFNPLIEGTDILKEELLSPLLKDADIKNFEVFIVGDNVYKFGKLKEIVKHMK